jgi:hypothetical protein
MTARPTKARLIFAGKRGDGHIRRGIGLGKAVLRAVSDGMNGGTGG